MQGTVQLLPIDTFAMRNVLSTSINSIGGQNDRMLVEWVQEDSTLVGGAPTFERVIFGNIEFPGTAGSDPSDPGPNLDCRVGGS